jgi:hypothetical protein
MKTPWKRKETSGDSLASKKAASDQVLLAAGHDQIEV